VRVSYIRYLYFIDLVPSGFPREILEAKIVGIPEAIDNLTERGAIDPVIKATVVLSESGFISVGDAIAYGEIKDDSITGTYLLSLLFLIMKLE
jgi:hypoxia up-regulated 1